VRRKIAARDDRDLHGLEILRTYQERVRVGGGFAGPHGLIVERCRRHRRLRRKSGCVHSRNSRQPPIEIGIVGQRIHSSLAARPVGRRYHLQIGWVEGERNGLEVIQRPSEPCRSQK
jgi:hypothetical protein